MERKLPFRLPSQTAWRSSASALALALISLWLAAGEFGVGSFVLFALALGALTLQFSEWRRVRFSWYALTLVSGILFSRATPMLMAPWFEAALVGALSALLFLSAAALRDPHRIIPRVLTVTLTLLAAFLFFRDSSWLTFAVFILVTALTARDEARSWGALRVGEGKLMGAAVALVGAELAAFIGLLPLGSARAAALAAFVLLLVREGLSEALQGGLRPVVLFRGLAVFFTCAVLLFASVHWGV